MLKVDHFEGQWVGKLPRKWKIFSNRVKRYSSNPLMALQSNPCCAAALQMAKVRLHPFPVLKKEHLRLNNDRDDSKLLPVHSVI